MHERREINLRLCCLESKKKSYLTEQLLHTFLFSTSHTTKCIRRSEKFSVLTNFISSINVHHMTFISKSKAQNGTTKGTRTYLYWFWSKLLDTTFLISRVVFISVICYSLQKKKRKFKSASLEHCLCLYSVISFGKTIKIICFHTYSTYHTLFRSMWVCVIKTFVLS